MTRPNDYLLENVWKHKTDDLKNEVIEFWIQNNALPSHEQAGQRVEQVFCIGRDADTRRIAGLSSVYENHNRRLDHFFYYYRSFVAPDHRRSQLGTQLLIFTRDNLERAFVEKDQTRCIGMFIEVENEYLKTYRNEAVWSNSRFVYIGKNEKGAHQRVYYFDGARIS